MSMAKKTWGKQTRVYARAAVRSRWRPEKKTMKNVMTRLMKAGCETYVEALLHVAHVQPLASAVYGCGVYRANCRALFCCNLPLEIG
jgi:hypothetical protein